MEREVHVESFLDGMGLMASLALGGPCFITSLYSNDLPVDGTETLFSSVTTLDDRSEMIALRFAISRCCMATVQ